ncbi:FadR/GntR family transcriptional regulator [Leucobacter sp. GX24907]
MATGSRTSGSVLAKPLAEGGPNLTLRTEVANRLITAVALGDYIPGQRFPPERDLAVMLGVARVTVRAAISDLVERGLLRRQQGRSGGTFVIEPDTPEAGAAVKQALSIAWDKLIDQHEAECWMHGMIAAAAAERRSDDDVAILQEKLETYRQAGSGAPAQKADEQLHLAIADAAHSPTLRESLLSLERQMHLSAPAHPWGAESSWKELELRALRDHEKLVAAITDGDVLAAHEIGRTHARINLEMLEETMLHAERASERAAREDPPEVR